MCQHHYRVDPESEVIQQLPEGFGQGLFGVLKEVCMKCHSIAFGTATYQAYKNAHPNFARRITLTPPQQVATFKTTKRKRERRVSL